MTDQTFVSVQRGTEKDSLHKSEGDLYRLFFIQKIYLLNRL